MRKSSRKGETPAREPAQTPPPARLSPSSPQSGSAEPEATADPAARPASSEPAPASTDRGATEKQPAATDKVEDKGAGKGAAAPGDQQRGATAAQKSDDPLRGSRASGFWATVVVLLVVLVLLAIFVLQNTQQVEISFLGWSGTAPLAAALMIAAAGALLLAVAAGALRILQLRRRVKHDRKQEKKAQKAAAR